MTMRGCLLALATALLLGETACADPAPAPAAQAEDAPSALAESAPAATPAQAEAPTPAPERGPGRVFGHFPYAEAPREALRAATCSGGGERSLFRADAYDALVRMRRAAKEAGVTLSPSSCFRAIASQRALYTCAAAPNGTGCANGRRVSEKQRATAVAPPGHSEHHTGYAIDFFPSATDIGAGGCPSSAACTTTARFAQSRSGRWLAAHAQEFGFEQSFWPGSTQGVMIEPWHYRYVGSPEAEAIFHAARTQFPSPHAGVVQP